MHLRATGNRSRLVVLTGCRSVDDVMLASAQDLDLVVHHPSQWALLEQADAAKPLHLWIKVDTGMHRLGFLPEQWSDIHTRLAQLGRKVASVRLMSHLANADDLEDEKTHQQKKLFDQSRFPAEIERSLANSAALLRYPATHADWVRPGIMLYGASPFAEVSAADLGLRLAMTLSSEIISVREIQSGEQVGYGGLFQADRKMLIGVVACGYADGYPRLLSNGIGKMWLNNSLAPVIGNVCMDMTMLDITGIDAQEGDEVIVFGAALPVSKMAALAQSIPYEILTGISQRVKRVYFEE